MLDVGRKVKMKDRYAVFPKVQQNAILERKINQVMKDSIFYLMSINNDIS